MKSMHKKSTKRKTLKTKYKIEKKVREHNRRLRKEAKKLKDLGVVKKRSSFDNKIPNSFPLKKQIMEQYEKRKLQKLQEQNKAKIVDESEEGSVVSEIQEVDDLTHKPQFNELKVEKKKYVDMNKKHKKFAGQVIQASQIILEVLDARSPALTRDQETETKILSLAEGKKLILLINKADLVSKKYLESQVEALEQEYETFVFDPKNAQALIDYVKQYTSEKVHTVGIIGLPFVGKSTIIKKLKECVDADVSQQGTKMKSNFQLAEGLKCVEYTGIINHKCDEITQAMKFSIHPMDIQNKNAAVDGILQQIPKEDLLVQYEIADFETTGEFLRNLARQRSIFDKGNMPNAEKAAKIVISDWLNGVLKYEAPSN